MKLNEEQTRAVEHSMDVAACLIAGAGSGKTRVMTERVRWLMGQGVMPRRILAVTFTNKAAGELVHRLGLTPETENAPRVSTIHALALRGIRRDPKAFGFQQKITPLDEYDQKQLLKKIIERHKFDDEKNDFGYMARLLEKIGYHRAHGIGFSNEYTEAVHQAAQLKHAGYHVMDEDELDLWKEFEIEKRANSVADFDDMLHLVVRRMRTDSAWLTVLQRQFAHVLMDEAQDTNETQWELINGLLGPENRNLYVVGDLNQSIYAFNGAVPELMRQYSEDWRGQTPTLYRIARNHRSVPQIVDFANAIQKKMTMTLPLHMESWRGMQKESGTVTRIDADFPSDIAHGMAMEIYRDSCRKREPIPYKDNAVLVRSAIQIRDIEGAFVKRRIPYVVRGGRGLLQTEEIRDLMAYLRLAANHKDFVSLIRSTSAPRCGVGEATLEKLRSTANEKYNGDLLQACQENTRLHNFCQVIEHATLFKDSPVIALEKVVAMSQYKLYVQTKYKREAHRVRAKLENIERFATMIVMLAQEPNATLEDLIFQLTLDRPKGDDAEEQEAVEQAFKDGKLTALEYEAKIKVLTEGSVTISTVHSAKGLEWKRVYVTNLVEGSLPHKFSMGSDDEIEEERRLFYVAATRARDNLVLCVPKMQQNEANTSKLRPSRFLTELT